jgi:UDP-glucose 4-epimerase
MTESLTVGITGAAGYIGSCVSARLLEAGHELVPVDNFAAAKVDAIDGQAIHEVDVRDRAAVREAFDAVDAVLHLAAISGVPDCEERPEAAFDANVVGTENVAWVCRERGLPLVFAGSMAILGDPVRFPIAADHPREPLNLYGRTKQMGEDDVHSLSEGHYPALVLMKSNIYGQHEVDGEQVGKETVVNKFVDQAKAGEPVTVYRPGTQARDFIHLEDVARAYERALEFVVDADDGTRTLTIGSGECRSVDWLAETVQRVGGEELGVQPEIAVLENPRTFETVTEDFTVETDTAREVIGFEAERTLDSSIREMLRG